MGGRGRERERQRETETERWKQTLKQAPGSELSTQSLTRGSDSGTTRSRPELKLDTQPTKPHRHPHPNSIHY